MSSPDDLEICDSCNSPLTDKDGYCLAHCPLLPRLMSSDEITVLIIDRYPGISTRYPGLFPDGVESAEKR